MPRGPRRNLRPVAASRSQPSVSTSTSSWPTDWHASSRNGTPALRVRAPTASAGFTTPPPVGTCVSATRATSVSSRRSSWSRSTWPCSSSSITSSVAPVRSHACRSAIALLMYSVRAVRMRCPALERDRRERHVPGGGRALHQRDLVRLRADQPRDRAVHRRPPAPRTRPPPRTDRSPPPAAGARRRCRSPPAGAALPRRCSGGRRARCRACHGGPCRGQSRSIVTLTESRQRPRAGRPHIRASGRPDLRTSRPPSGRPQIERQDDRTCGRPHSCRVDPRRTCGRCGGSAAARAPEDDGGAVGRGRRAAAAARGAVDRDDVAAGVGREDAAARVDERAQVLDLPLQAARAPPRARGSA